MKPQIPWDSPHLMASLWTVCRRPAFTREDEGASAVVPRAGSTVIPACSARYSRSAALGTGSAFADKLSTANEFDPAATVCDNLSAEPETRIDHLSANKNMMPAAGRVAAGDAASRVTVPGEPVMLRQTALDAEGPLGPVTHPRRCEEPAPPRSRRHRRRAGSGVLAGRRGCVAAVAVTDPAETGAAARGCPPGSFSSAPPASDAKLSFGHHCIHGMAMSRWNNYSTTTGEFPITSLSSTLDEMNHTMRRP